MKGDLAGDLAEDWGSLGVLRASFDQVGHEHCVSMGPWPPPGLRSEERDLVAEVF